MPIDAGIVGDTTRIEDSIPTLKLLRAHHCSCIILSHFDRPDGEPNPEKSLKPILPILKTHLSEDITFIDYLPDLNQALNLSSSPIIFLENLRFWPEEEANDLRFAQTLAKFGDVYVNEAFANCHRDHASMTGIPAIIPGYAGLSLVKEIKVLQKVTLNPERPLVVVVGGAKLETKTPLINAFASMADAILVGGKIAKTMQNQPNLPNNVFLASLTADSKDITPESATQFSQKILSAGTVIWNGTMGIFEDPAAKQGTTTVAQAINQTHGFTLIGGGDTEAALTELNLEAGIDYISTGGGAMLTFLSEGNLVALKPLIES